MQNTTPVSVEILIGSQCPHCAALLSLLVERAKNGRIGRLTVINLEAQPDLAAQWGVRTVPAMRLERFLLTGAYNATELDRWLNYASEPDSPTARLEYAITRAELNTAEQFATSREGAAALLTLLGAVDTPLNTRIGLGAIIETLAENPLDDDLLDGLIELCRNDNESIRADACHYLGLSENVRAIPALEQAGQDPSATIREIALESLAAIRAAT